jgi:hypothetical protein
MFSRRATMMLILGAGLAGSGLIPAAAIAGAGKKVLKVPKTVNAIAADYTVDLLEIVVPQSLTVSEANLFLPLADIVWRGDPLGDRYAQVKAIFEEGMGRAVAGLTGPTHVKVKIEVVRFHALTEKARAITGGKFAIDFKVSVRDVVTGEQLRPDRLVNADLKASGGSRALMEEAKGLTEKVILTSRLEETIRYVLEFGA